MSAKKRIVVTGVGSVCGVGANTQTIFNNLMASKSGIAKISLFDTTGLDVTIAGEVKRPKTEEDKLNPYFFDVDKFVDKKDQRKMDAFMHFAMAATEEALTQANWKPTDTYSLERTGVTIGSGIGGLGVIQDEVTLMNEKGPSRVSPFFVPRALINLASGWVSIKYGFMGPNHSVVTACATGAHAIYNAAQMIQEGDADVVVCGGAESAICKIGIAGFNAARALSSKRDNDPEAASRPWDADRDGFVMGEGAGILILEDYEHAKKRGAKILAEYVSAGLSGDAYHITAPESTGRGARLAMKMALQKAGISGDQIDYVNAHGTSTPLGDMIELKGVHEVLGGGKSGKRLMSSTKSATGHLLGAAGSLEAVICIESVLRGIVPPTLNLDNPSEGCEMFDLIPHNAREMGLNYVMSNSFGFGGTNISLIFKKFND